MNLLITSEPFILIPASPLNAQRSPISRNLIEEKIASILVDSYYFPSNRSFNGAFFIDNLKFAANIKVLGQKLGINPNSLHKDFRHHKIKCIQKLPASKIINIYDVKGWKIYQHSNHLFSLQNILRGNIQVTSKWDKNTKKGSKNKNDQKEIKIFQKNNVRNNEKKQCKKTVTTIRYLSKTHECDESFFSEDDSYFDYLE